MRPLPHTWGLLRKFLLVLWRTGGNIVSCWTELSRWHILSHYYISAMNDFDQRIHNFSKWVTSLVEAYTQYTHTSTSVISIYHIYHKISIYPYKAYIIHCTCRGKLAHQLYISNNKMKELIAKRADVSRELQKWLWYSI